MIIHTRMSVRQKVLDEMYHAFTFQSDFRTFKAIFNYTHGYKLHVSKIWSKNRTLNFEYSLELNLFIPLNPWHGGPPHNNSTSPFWGNLCPFASYSFPCLKKAQKVDSVAVSKRYKARKKHRALEKIMFPECYSNNGENDDSRENPENMKNKKKEHTINAS